MNVTTILLVITLLMFSSNTPPKTVESPLPPLQEDQVQVHWMKEGDIAPFDGILMNDYTYERIRLKLLERGQGR